MQRKCLLRNTLLVFWRNAIRYLTLLSSAKNWIKWSSPSITSNFVYSLTVFTCWFTNFHWPWSKKWSQAQVISSSLILNMKISTTSIAMKNFCHTCFKRIESYLQQNWILLLHISEQWWACSPRTTLPSSTPSKEIYQGYTVASLEIDA